MPLNRSVRRVTCHVATAETYILHFFPSKITVTFELKVKRHDIQFWHRQHVVQPSLRNKWISTVAYGHSACLRSKGYSWNPAWKDDLTEMAAGKKLANDHTCPVVFPPHGPPVRTSFQIFLFFCSSAITDSRSVSSFILVGKFKFRQKNKIKRRKK